MAVTRSSSIPRRFFDGTRPIVESPQHLSLHIPHFLDEFITETVHIPTEFAAELVHASAELGHAATQLGPEFGLELVQVFLGRGAVFFFSRHGSH